MILRGRRAFVSLPKSPVSNSILRRLYSNTIKEHDVVHIRQQGAKSPKWHLTKPLLRDANVKLARGASVAASDLIGRNYLDILHDSRGYRLVLHEPSLADYILLSDRIATPIYPHDATTIVSLLDINLPRAGDDDAPSPSSPFEVFEAGTGMGSLTIHIARALHAANPPVPAALRTALVSSGLVRRDAPAPSRLDLDPDAADAFAEYRASRGAVLHSLDRNVNHSRQAHTLLRRYRRAMYLPDVDFHVGQVDAWVDSRLRESNDEPFLSRAVLDLPGAQNIAGPVVRALRHNGLLVVFAPSISQIGEFSAWMASTAQPLSLDKVLELPNTSISDGKHETGGGRVWEVKTVIPRDAEEGSDKMVQVMRPKVGDRLAGGGFVAVLRRLRERGIAGQDDTLAEEASEKISETEAEEEAETSDSDASEPEPRL